MTTFILCTGLNESMTALTAAGNTLQPGTTTQAQCAQAIQVVPTASLGPGYLENG